MIKKILLTGVAVFAVGLGAAAAQDRVVNVYNWSDYVDDEVLKQFEEETGISVNYDVFDSNEVLETKLLTGSTGYDVVAPTAQFLNRQVQAGVFQKLDRDKLPNLKHMDKTLMERLSKLDPENAYSINYMWGTSGMGINREKILALAPEAPLNSWELLFNPEILKQFSECGVHVMDEPDEMFPAALHYLGMGPDSNNPDDIRKAGELLKSIRPYVLKFHNSEFVNALANGDICLAYGWSGDVLQASDRAAEAGNGVELEYILPVEGGQMWFDQFAIPADAPNADEAHEFLNFIMRPEIAGKLSNYVYYANGNADSVPFIDEEVTSNPGIYPPQEVKEKLYTVTAKPLKTQRVMTREWTAIKSGQ
ncbi:polyamine ABC transporter substrate-binding protein [Pseudovibrio exalbescens]|uniref:polyamine ABC transporter substrate-binding protein n=1 Tax=Pseudovibrio exalbescens TaxID=197461 RepID=UPI0023665255|nr:polyamine ABC transporter substrate-binding protein [Pseudovibrio exalbescens]MDD7912111.1 polyamine ABC transporter substrate-binding protein [Pseudovibrio exalbescens]